VEEIAMTFSASEEEKEEGKIEEELQKVKFGRVKLQSEISESKTRKPGFRWVNVPTNNFESKTTL
jgi:hypothetical protein